MSNDTAFSWFEINPNSAFGSSVFMELWADTADFNQLTFGVGYTDTSTWIDSIYFLDTITNRLDTLLVTPLGGNSQYMTWAEEINGRYLLQVLIINPPTGRYYGLLTMGTGEYDIWGASWLRISNLVSTGLPSTQQYPNIQYFVTPDTLQSIVSGWACAPNLITVANYNNRYDFENVDGGRHVTVDLPIGGLEQLQALGRPVMVKSSRIWQRQVTLP
ncbi:hypothetical protein KFE98_00610 [bacterium SCSIO 12741]|nr:hypothetical protein KFE98_00610 [bacterium SCSIO 12741]